MVLFDVDGTLVDAAGAGRRALEEAFRRVHERPDITRAAAAVAFGGKTDPTIIAEMARAAGVREAELVRRAAAFERAYLDALRGEMAREDPRRRIMPGVVPLLEHLHARDDVSIGLLTGNIEAGARAKLDPFGLNRFFPTGGFGSDHGDRRRIALHAAEVLAAHRGCALSSCRVCVVGDTELDVECARANGFDAVAVLTGWSTRELLRAAGADVILDDLSDLDVTLAALGLAPDQARV